MPGQIFDRALTQLIRAEGCWLELQESQKETAALRAQVKEQEKASEALAQADSLTDAIEENERTLTKKEKRAQWFKTAKKDITAVALGTVAAAQAAYIIYTTIKPQ